jgi:predicted esterase
VWTALARRAHLAPAVAVLLGGGLVASLIPAHEVGSRLARAALGLGGVLAATALLRLGLALAAALGRTLRRSARRPFQLAWARYRPDAPASAWRSLLAADLAVAVATFALLRSAASAFEALESWATVAFAASLALAAVLATTLLALAALLAAQGRAARALELAAAVAVLAAAPVLVAWALHPSAPEPPAGPDPALPGLAAPSEPYAVQVFSYGPGDDLRPAYGRDARVVTQRADLSNVLPGGWSAARAQHWGFGPGSLPVSGKAWVPVGASAVPLVLLVHGTRDMRVPSEDGLAYLAQALAARGIAAAAIDQNFLGYGSFAGAGELEGSDVEARAALVVAHLESWHAMATERGSPLRGAVDLQRVLLVGHSRGGEAIATAARLLAGGVGEGRYRVRALAALAPTENDGPVVPEVSYLALHGDLDNDVEAFLGVRAYGRLRVGRLAGETPRDRDLLKAAVLVHGANHSQFNAAWGRTDKPWPSSLLERRGHLLPAWKQRRVAATLVTAFAEATLLGSRSGRAVLHDARRVLAGAGVRVRAKYQDGASELLATFDDDVDPASGSVGGSRIEAQGFHGWSELDPPLRLPDHFGTRMNRVVELTWGARAAAGGAAPRLSISVPERLDRDRHPGGSLAFGVAYPAEAPDLEIRLADARGVAAGVRLRDHVELEPLRDARFSILQFLERPTSETFLETAVVPLAAFLAREPRLDLATLRRVEFVFRSAPGTVRIDDVRLLEGPGPGATAPAPAAGGGPPPQP